jgi:hypothetical protein
MGGCFHRTGSSDKERYLCHRSRLERTIIKTVADYETVRQAASRAIGANASPAKRKASTLAGAAQTSKAGEICPPRGTPTERPLPLLELKCINAVANVIADLGRPEGIGNAFASFQKHLDDVAVQDVGQKGARSETKRLDATNCHVEPSESAP